MSMNRRLLQSVVYIALAAAPAEAGRFRRQCRAEELRQGITAAKWQTRKYRAESLSNITAPLGWFSPGRLIWGILTGR